MVLSKQFKLQFRFLIRKAISSQKTPLLCSNKVVRQKVKAKLHFISVQGMPQGTDFDEQEQALPDFTLAADVAYFPLSRPSGAPVDTGDLVFTSEHISETDSEDTLPLGESGPVADWPEAQPRNMAQGLTLPAPQVLPQPGPERQPPTRPQSARQEPPVLQQHELPVSGPAMAQQQELKQERLQVGQCFGQNTHRFLVQLAM